MRCGYVVLMVEVNLNLDEIEKLNEAAAKSGRTPVDGTARIAEALSDAVKLSFVTASRVSNAMSPSPDIIAGEGLEDGGPNDGRTSRP